MNGETEPPKDTAGQSEGPAHARHLGATAWLWLSVLVIALDQGTKWLIVQRVELWESIAVNRFLDITHLHNTGAAFSFLADASGWQRWFFIALAIAVSIVIMIWLRRLPPRGQSPLAAGLALILGGALGNVIDRAHLGYVIDFIHVHWGDAYFPAFNVADSAISVGAGLLILDALFLGRRRESAAAGDSG